MGWKKDSSYAMIYLSSVLFAQSLHPCVQFNTLFPPYF